MSVMAMSAEQWAEEQFGECELGDRRRTRRMVDMATLLAKRVGKSISCASDGDSAANEGAYRLVRNDSVKPEAIAEGGYGATAKRCRGVELLLAVEDTTSLSYRHSATEELGELGGGGGKARGFWAHSVLMVDGRSTRTLGLIVQQRWCRAPREKRQGKESEKWLTSSAQLRERLDAKTLSRVVSVCDREADFYACLADKADHGQRYVIRCSWDRKLRGHEHEHLLSAVQSSEALGRYDIEVSQRGGKHGRAKRKATITLRACTVQLAPQGDTEPLTINVVLAREETAGVEDKDRLHWLLLTSESVEDFAAAQEVVRLYTLRWRVEDFHKAWKTGAGVERQRHQSADNLERMAVVLAFIAVRLLQLREVLEPPVEPSHAKRACTEVLTEDEWQVLWVTRHKKRPPSKAPTMQWAYESIGKLGGFLDTKRTGRMSWEAYWNGWFRLQERTEAFQAALQYMK